MTPKEFVAVANEVKYRPGWRIDAVLFQQFTHGYAAYGAVDMTMVAKVHDLYDGEGRPIDVLMRRVVPREYVERMDLTSVLDYLRQWFMEMEDHESREHFTYRGVRVFDPHKEPRP